MALTLKEQINAINTALDNKNWSGDWGGGGEGAVNLATKKLEERGVKDLTKLKVEPEYEEVEVLEQYNGQKVYQDSPTGPKYVFVQTAPPARYDIDGNYIAGSPPDKVPVPSNQTQLLKPASSTYKDSDYGGYYETNYAPLTEKDLSRYDPKTKTFTTDFLVGNKLVNTETNEVISRSPDTNFFIDTYTTGNILKGQDKRFGLTLSPDGIIVPYQTSGKAGFLASPVAGLILSAFAPGVSNLLGAATGLTGTGLSIATGAAVGGGTAALTGGDVLKGALSGGVTAGASNLVTPAISNALGGGTFGNIAAGTLTGGGISSLLGGDFASGALRGGLSAGLNNYEQQLRQEQFDTGMTESGLAGQTLMDSGEQTVLEPWQQTDSISQLVDKLSPYLQSYVLGENEVFAEPDIQQGPIDNAGKLKAIGILKTLTPVALMALLAKSAAGSSNTEETSGYPIVPIPADWKSPTYNQAFTPSAPIDFGTSALLAGTQWENPQQFQAPQEYNLTNLINTLNYQPVPFVPQQYEMPQQVSTADFVSQFQQPTVGTSDIIGNLGGSPVSIADIISGIQSQYG